VVEDDGAGQRDPDGRAGDERRSGPARRQTAVPLTSVRQPRRELGRTAADLLLDEAVNPEHQHQQVLFTPVLVARASTRSIG
jgi:LacI family transcriptional regulator